jgi:uncharacterized membrane protein YraQ (UPF0718 family)
MLENLKVNIVLGFISFLFTYLFSIFNNTWQTSLYRAAAGFILFFFLGFVFHIVMKQMAGKSHPAHKDISVEEVEVKQKVEKNNAEVEEMTDTAGFQTVSLHSLHYQEDGEKR